MEIPILIDLLLLLGLAVAVLLFCHRLKVASVVGFLVTGIVAGPHGLGLVGAVHKVEILAEVGVVLLLFTIGIEFSLGNLLRIRRSVVMGGSLQVILTIFATFLTANMLGMDAPRALFLGFLASLSSTAIVLKLLQQRAEMESPHGQTTVAILIFQDLIFVPMVLMVPVLAGVGIGTEGSSFLQISKGVGFLLLVLASARWIVPRVLYVVAKTRSRELFVLTVLLICFAVALLTQRMGLSLALGAFLAGLIISETEFSHETLGKIIPFRDVFTSIFFVSIGMLLDATVFIEHPFLVLLISLCILALKSLLAGTAVLFLGFPIRTAVLTGVSLSQIGEFSFVLFLRGTEFGLLSQDFYQFFLTVAILTMAITPFAIALAPRIAEVMQHLPLSRRLKTGICGKSMEEAGIAAERKKGHLVIVGYGFNGRNLANAARATGIPYIIIEMNPQTVREERKRGEPIFYGDASQEEVLRHSNIREARAMVVVISDPMASRRMTAAARKENPKFHIIVRTRYVSEMEELYKLGANEVVPEEFETSVEIFSRVLARYLVPREDIQKLIMEARAHGYEMFRTRSTETASLRDLTVQLPNVEVVTSRVAPRAPVAGRSLAQADVRKRYGITVLAIQRDNSILANPDGETVMEPGDILLLLAERPDAPNLLRLFQDLGNVENDQHDGP